MTTEEALSAVENALKSGDAAGAEAQLTRAWPTTSQMPPDALHLFAMVRMQQKRLPEAEQFMRGAIASDPKALRHHIALGHMMAATENHAAAAAAYGEALRIDMSWPGLLETYTLACYRCGRYSEAEKAARSWLKSTPSAAGWDALSCTLRAQNKPQEALTAADEGIALAPESFPLQHSRGAALLKLGRAQEALDIFDRLSAQGVQAPAIWLNRGNALASLKRKNDAVAAFSEGVRRWPNDPELQQALAAARR